MAHFLRHPDPRCIPLSLHSFGGSGGGGMYQLVENVLLCYSPQEVLPHLLSSLASPQTRVRQWSAQVAIHFPDACLVSPLAHLLADKDEDVNSSDIIALHQISEPRVASILAIYAESESDEDLRSLALSEN